MRDLGSAEGRSSLLGAKNPDAGNRISLLNVNSAESLCHCISRDCVRMVMSLTGLHVVHDPNIDHARIVDRNKLGAAETAG